MDISSAIKDNISNIKLNVMKGYQKIIKLLPSGHGHWKIWIEFRGNIYNSVTSNMPTLDKYKSDDRGWKQAGNDLYNEVVRKNNLK